MRLVLRAAAAAALFAATAAPATAAVQFFTSSAGFQAAAPAAFDVTGMSAVSTTAQARSLSSAPPSTWTNSNPIRDIVLGGGLVTFHIPGAHGTGDRHEFQVGLDGGASSSAVGFNGAVYKISNPTDEAHDILFSGVGAYAFGFNIFEPSNINQCGGVGCLRSTFTLNAYDAAGTLLGTSSVTPNFSFVFLGLTSTDAIAKVTIREHSTPLPTVLCCGYDNEYFGNYLFSGVAAVPEPSAWSMLVVGMVGLGLVARRKDRRVASTA